MIRSLNAAFAVLFVTLCIWDLLGHSIWWAALDIWAAVLCMLPFCRRHEPKQTGSDAKPEDR